MFSSDSRVLWCVVCLSLVACTNPGDSSDAGTDAGRRTGGGTATGGGSHSGGGTSATGGGSSTTGGGSSATGGGSSATGGGGSATGGGTSATGGGDSATGGGSSATGGGSSATGGGSSATGGGSSATGGGTTTATLTVDVTGPGTGVVGDGAGFVCDSHCTHSYALGAMVSLVPAPKPGSVFTGWSGACTGTGACTVTLSGPVTVGAVFSVAPPQALTVNLSSFGGGQGVVVSTPGGISCPPACDAGFPQGTTVTLTGKPDAGSSFGVWSGACTGTDASCSLVLNGPKSVGATFTVQANYAFVSSLFVAPGTLSNGDSLCQSMAADAGLPGTYIALLPTATKSIVERIGTARGWVRVDGRPFLDQFADGISDNNKFFYPLSLNEHGGPVSNYIVTGANVDGTASAKTCSFWTDASGTATAQLGTRGKTAGSQWLYGGSTLFTACSTTSQFYCFGIDRSAPLLVVPNGPVRHAFASSAPLVSPGGVSGADTICANEAADAGLPGTYLAWLNTETATASSRFDAGGLPYARVDGVMIAPTAAEMLGASAGYLPLAQITTNAKGAYTSPGYAIWTGGPSPTQLTASETCNSWTATSGFGRIGLTSDNIGGWWFDAMQTVPCNFTASRIYCLEK